MTDVILILIVVLIAGLAARYIVREKKNGRHCIGCPHAGHCGGCCGTNTSGTPDRAEQDDTSTEQ